MANIKYIQNVFRKTDISLCDDLHSRIQKIIDVDADILSDEEKYQKIEELKRSYEDKVDYKFKNWIQIDQPMLGKVAVEIYKNASDRALCFAVRDLLLEDMDKNGFARISAGKIADRLEAQKTTVYKAIRTLRKMGLFKDVAKNSEESKMYIMSNAESKKITNNKIIAFNECFVRKRKSNKRWQRDQLLAIVKDNERPWWMKKGGVQGGQKNTKQKELPLHELKRITGC